MKPTKEQLADPKWWDTYAKDGDDYCYFDHDICEYFFSNNEYMAIELGNSLELLAKRPEPEKWVPSVGEWYEVESDTRGVWKKALYVGVDSIGSHVFDVEKRHLWRIDSIKTLVRPIKTQREEFVEEAKSRIKNMDEDDIILAGKLYDSGCRFDLTEKDGE